ncbi:hypothetical protein POX_c04510 [Penicillium oxalicum]|uniref:Uncharacterized protein n=1 Tax=Penicillium oxalicum (strain 114-2 / CGMCC 5302) TaxID=933388 RepID=S7ZBR0_PENO1|nr:hypothetical protein POX_c04510 [Penicillium oxalicum]EPS26126.1 hypothetical protein PDE_01062 [Penicillium oxalicum 114-2]KAI2791644.1 hypothetical protein POX_c04510 [Penicillium oxalicum]
MGTNKSSTCNANIRLLFCARDLTALGGPSSRLQPVWMRLGVPSAPRILTARLLVIQSLGLGNLKLLAPVARVHVAPAIMCTSIDAV